MNLNFRTLHHHRFALALPALLLPVLAAACAAGHQRFTDRMGLRMSRIFRSGEIEKMQHRPRLRLRQMPSAGLLALSLLCLIGQPSGFAVQRTPVTQDEAVAARIHELIPPVQSVHPSMKADGRMTAPVTLAMGDIPMADLLAELTRLTGVPLSASDEAADDMVIAGFKGRTLGSILALLSTHFGFTWRKKRDGYEIWQDLASKKREEALRSARRLALVQYALELSRLAQRPDAELTARRTEVRGILRDRALSPEARLRLNQEATALNHLRNGAARFSLRALSRAPAASIQQLPASGELTLSTGRGEISPAEVARWSEQQKEEPGRRGSRTPQADQPIESLQVSYKIGQRGVTALDTESLQLQVRERRAHGSSSRGVSLPGPTDGQSRWPAAIDPRLARPADTGSRGLRYPGEFRSGPYLYPWRHTLSQWPDERPSVADSLLAMHAATGLDLLSDSFAPWRPLPTPAVTRRTDFQSLLGEICGYQQTASLISDGLLRLRQSRYFELRAAAPPVRALRAIARRTPLDERAYLLVVIDLVAGLTERERLSLTRDWGYLWAQHANFMPAPELSHSVDLSLPVLLARLSPKLRGELMTGEPVGLKSLSRMDLANLGARLVEAAQAREALVGRTRPNTQPLSIKLSAWSSLQEVHATYDDDGKPRSTSTRTLQPGESIPPPPNFDGGRSSEPVGAPYGVTVFHLQLIGEMGHISTSLAHIQLVPPAPYQVRPRSGLPGRSPPR